MKDLPKVKNEIVFDDSFIEKIKNDEKRLTIRNSPVSLECYKIDKDLTIEVVSCKKVYIWIRHLDNIMWITEPMAPNRYQIYFKDLGFESKDEMNKYYKKYLKRDFAYVITFNICEATR